MDRPPEPPSRVDSLTDDITLVLPADAETEAAPPPPPRRSRVWIVVLIVASVIAGAATAIGLVVSGNDGDGQTSSGVSPPSPSPVILTPTGLTAEPDVAQVSLTWTQPSGGAEVGTYNVYRDGVLTGSVRATSTTFTDNEVRPGQSYVYEVEGAGGGIVSSRASMTVKVPVPPLREARVEGVFDVAVNVKSSHGYEEITSRFNAGWEFTPRCEEGPCTVVWEGIVYEDVRAPLRRRGPRYTGSFSRKFGIDCRGGATTSQVTIRFKVVKARVTSGEWRATRLTGTLEHKEAPQFGCVSSGATYSFTARL